MLKKFDEMGRLEEVNSYKIEDTLTEKEYDDIAFLASAICGTPIALVTLMYKERQWFKAATGTDLKENKRELSFCTHAMAGEEDVMVVENATEDVRFMHNPLVQGDPYLVFYAGAPIVNKNGYSIGTVCVYDVIKKSLTNKQIKGLKILSEQVMGLLELRKQNLRLENDIHEKVEVHKLIEASEAKFRHLILHAQVLITVFQGPSFIVETINEKALEIWGKSYDEVINKPLFEVSPKLEAKGKKILDDIYTSGKPLITNERKVQSKRYGKPDTAYFNSIYQPLRNSDNKISGIILIATEVTEAVNARKRIEESAEEQKKMAKDLKLATDSANIGIWSLDLISSKLQWSNLHKAMWGYDEHREELIYEDWHKLIVAEDKDLAFQRIEESKVNQDIYDVEYRINRTTDGAVVWVKSIGQYHYDEFGAAHTLTGISIDISEQKRMNEELVEAKSKAESALQSKQQFLANMSHEIRTPMTAIFGFTKVLLKTDLSEKQKEYLQAIKSSGNTLIVLIDDILDLAKVDAGKMIFVNAPFKISHSLTTIIHLFEANIQEKNLELIKEHDSRIPEILLGDSVRLHQILINLLSNAIKFTVKGKIIVSVNLINEDEEKVTLEIKVTDTGIGIPENKIAAIFENFEQASAFTSSLYGGTGLGLPIVKQLVEKQGGTVSVKSKVGKGSTFGFTLSFQKTQTEIELESGEVILENEIKDIKILIVEDVKLNQLLLRTILDDFKFAWDVADNGKIAVEKLETNSYDIILMDLQMPVMNGFEATEYIRNKMNLQIPIIALTADVTTVDLEKCKAAGMNDYISKPIDEKLLHNKILDLIKSK